MKPTGGSETTAGSYKPRTHRMATRSMVRAARDRIPKIAPANGITKKKTPKQRIKERKRVNQLLQVFNYKQTQICSRKIQPLTFEDRIRFSGHKKGHVVLVWESTDPENLEAVRLAEVRNTTSNACLSGADKTKARELRAAGILICNNYPVEKYATGRISLESGPVEDINALLSMADGLSL